MKKKKERYITSTSKRSFIKAFSWEAISFIITLVAVYLVYGDIKTSIKFTLAITGVKILFLYVHERIWKKIMWGKIYAKLDSRI
jgi:adenylylsulfate kinase